MKSVIEELFAMSSCADAADALLGGMLTNLYSFYTACLCWGCLMIVYLAILVFNMWYCHL